MAIGPSEAEPFWTAFLRCLTRRGLRGVKLVISDAHEGLKAAAAKVLKATWQRCEVHFLRNALAYASKGQRQMVLALINTVFAQETPEAAHHPVAHRRRSAAREVPEARHDDGSTPSTMCWPSWAFPKAHRVQIHSTNPLERLNAEIKRRTNVVGIFPNEAAIMRLVGALLMEQNDEYAIQNRYMSLESLALLSENPRRSAEQACWLRRGQRAPSHAELLHHASGHDLGNATPSGQKLLKPPHTRRKSMSCYAIATGS